MHGLRQRPTPVNWDRPYPLHLRGNPYLCDVTQLEILLAATTGEEAVATDCLVNVKEERAVELFSQAGATQGYGLNEQEAYPPCLRISTHCTDCCAHDRPLQLFKAGHHSRIRKCPRRENLGVEAPICTARIWDDVEDRIAKHRVSSTRRAQQCICINVLHGTTNRLLQRAARDKRCGEAALP
jgi:hypothetical protein